MDADVQFKIALFYQGKARYPMALEAWERFLREYPEEKRICKALFEVGYLKIMKLNKVQEGTLSFHRLIETDPTNKFAQEARKILDSLGIESRDGYS